MVSDGTHNDESKLNTSKAIGIDLGTTYSCVCAYRNGELSVISNAEGNRITPSIVAFDDEGGRIIGTTAEHRLTSNPDKVVYDVKRLIGRGYDAPVLASSIKKWPFKVVRWDHNTRRPTDVPAKPDAVDNIKISIPEQNNNVHYYDPIEISGHVLGYMKKAAEAVLNDNVTTAVITVPAHFNDNQKEKTKLAATVAGFKEVRLLNEPTAAALSYAYDKMKRKEATREEQVLVFDLGGGTFDVSILRFEPPTDGGSIAEVLNTEGDTFLGGVDFDNQLYEHCLEMFIKKNPTINKNDITDRAKRRLRMACEKAKRNLSSAASSPVEVECFHVQLNLSVNVTRVLFNKLCEKHFKRCIDKVRGCLLGLEGGDVSYTSDGYLAPQCLTQQAENLIQQGIRKIDRVIVVGGSSRILKIQEMLASLFGENKLDRSAHPDEAIARGAAYQAALISGGTKLDTECPLLLLDATPLHISIETLGGVATTIIPKNTIRPCTKSEVFSTAADNQTSVTINIYEGLASMVANNNLIGSFNLTGIAPAKRGIPQIEVTCDIDNSGILVVTARDKNSDKKEQLTVSNENRKTTPEQVQEMINKYEQFQEADKIKKEAVEAKNEYETLLFTITDQFAILKPELEKQGKTSEIQSIESEIDSHNNWLSNHPNATKEEYDVKKSELNDLLKRMSPTGPQMNNIDPSQYANKDAGSTAGYDSGYDEPKVDEVD